MQILCLNSTADRTLIWEPSYGELRHAIYAPKLTEELNKISKLTFTVPRQNVNYNAIRDLYSSIVLRDGSSDSSEVLFVGRVIDDQRDWDNNRQLTCEGALAYLHDVVMPPHDEYTTMLQVKEALMLQIAGQLEQVHQIWMDLDNVELTEPIPATDKCTTAYDLIQQVAANVGETAQIKLDYQLARVPMTHLTIITRPLTGSQEIAFGKNLLDIGVVDKLTDVFTGVYAIGKDGLLVDDDYPIVWDTTGVSRYGRITRTITYNDIETVAELQAAAAADAEKGGNPEQTYTVKALDLSTAGYDVRRFAVGTMIPVHAPQQGMPDGQLQCQKIAMDIENPERSAYTFGAARVSGAQEIANMQRTVAQTSARVDTAEENIAQNTEDIESQGQTLEDHTATLADHESRIQTLESGGGGGGDISALEARVDDLEDAMPGKLDSTTAASTYETQTDAADKLTEAKTYADGILTDAETYADQVAATAEGNANDYTDTALADYSKILTKTVTGTTNANGNLQLGLSVVTYRVLSVTVIDRNDSSTVVAIATVGKSATSNHLFAHCTLADTANTVMVNVDVTLSVFYIEI